MSLSVHLPQSSPSPGTPGEGRGEGTRPFGTALNDKAGRDPSFFLLHPSSFILILLLLSPAFAKSPKPDKKPIPDIDPQQITDWLDDDRPEEVDLALSLIDELLSTRGVAIVPTLRTTWLPLLIDNGHIDPALDVIHSATVECAADLSSIESLQTLRIRTLLGANRPREALSAARGLFNVCSMTGTKRSLLLISECLNTANPADKTIVDRFRAQQEAAATTRPIPPSPDPPILSSISIDPAPWQAGIERYDPSKYVFRANESRDLTAQANLLLLAGRPNEALDIFQRIKEKANSEQMPAALENIARAIKAQDAGIGRANAFLRSAGSKQ